MPTPRRRLSPRPVWGSPSVCRLPSTMGASGVAQDHRAGLSSPPRHSSLRRPRTRPAPGGIWGPGGKTRGVRAQHGVPQPPPRRVPSVGTPLPPPSGSLCQRARGNTQPGPSRAALWGHKHQLCWGRMCPLQLQGQPEGKGPNTHQCYSGLSQELHGSPSPSRGGPKFGTHHKEPPQ